MRAPYLSESCRSRPAQLALYVVRVGVLHDELVDLLVRDGIDDLDQVVDAVGVDRHAPPQLGLDLVALGHRDVAHVVAEPGQPHRGELRPPVRRACPRPDASRDARVADVAGDRLAFETQPGLDEAELAVAVRRLVQVHEVHVDLGPGQLDVGLGVQVQQRLVELRRGRVIHILAGRERVHPGDDPDARVVARSRRASAGGSPRRR